MANTTHETQHAAPCWVERWRGWGYEDLSDACVHLTPEQNEVIAALAAAERAQFGCGSDCAAEGDGYCWCEVHQIEAMCALDAGHEGPHLFVSPTRITLAFSPVAAA